MQEFLVYGVPGSPYLRKVLLGLEEKSLPWRLRPLALGEVKSPSYLERMPFARMPTIEHGELRLYESQAILRYLDRIAPTPLWTPTDPVREARMNQVCGIVDCYVMAHVSAPITFPRCVAPKFGLPVDEQRVAEAVPRAAICIRELSRLLAGQRFFAGDTLSIADLMLVPHLDYFITTEEAKPMFADAPNLVAWVERMRARPSMQATSWERLNELAKAA